MPSTAIGQDRVSAIVGYLLKAANLSLSSPNLPQRIAILAEANHANQSELDLDPFECTSAKQAGERYGYGSPIHMIMRILRPYSGDGVGGIPTVIYPQAAAGGASAKVMTVEVSGVATGNGTHFIKIAGRDGIDGSIYAINVEEGDTAADIHEKIEDAINNVLASPMSATSTQYEATLTAKWRGLTSQGVGVEVDTDEDDLGLTYVIAQTTAGAGTPDIATALALFGNVWNTIVLNGYGLVSTTMDSLEAHNGIPKDVNPTGRYSSTIWKPYIALSGSVVEDPSSITDTRDEDVTIAVCPAPLSSGLHFEAAANMCVLVAPIAQNTPHLDVADQSYPDMPTPTDIGDMADYENRDLFVKRGCSTVDLVSGKYKVKDLVTTYHPDGETPPQFRWVRNLIIDYNVRYAVLLLEAESVLGHAIANDNDTVAATNVVKPKTWKGRLIGLAEDLELRALTVDSDFMVESLSVAISTTNPDRFETFFRYKRSGFARQSATTAEAGFNFGTLNAQ